MLSVNHELVEANGVRLHVARSGVGRPLVLLHGWPEYWETWLPLMERLSKDFTLIAPDFRGFGDSEKPDGEMPSAAAGTDVLAQDIAVLMEKLGVGEFGIVAHDISAFTAQHLSRSMPKQISGAFYFDCPYPGMGIGRPPNPNLVKEAWYQGFAQLPWAAKMVGSSRENCADYLGHFLRHWSQNPSWVDEVLEHWVDNLMIPGNLQGGFNWYVSQARAAVAGGQPHPIAKITVPTCVRWGDCAVLPSAFADRLGDVFVNLDAAEFLGAGHFPHRETPDLAASEIAKFFDRVWAI